MILKKIQLLKKIYRKKLNNLDEKKELSLQDAKEIIDILENDLNDQVNEEAKYTEHEVMMESI